jgi:hypothetical protein
MLLKKGSLFLANSDSVCWMHSVAETCHDGSSDRRSEPVVLPVQPGTAHSGEPSSAPDQSGRDANTWRASRKAAVTPSSMTSGIEPQRNASTGVPHAMASIIRLLKLPTRHSIAEYWLRRDFRDILLLFNFGVFQQNRSITAARSRPRRGCFTPKSYAPVSDRHFSISVF